MNEKEQQEYLEQYKQAKDKGVYFFPDILFKDALIALLAFIVLIGLAYLVGAPLEERANPADTSYTPRPEWYFLFLFQLLKYFPGNLEFVGVVLLPTIAIIALFFLPLIDRNPKHHYTGRPLVIGFTAVIIIGIVGLTILAVIEAPPPVQAVTGDQTAALYLENCAPCHGDSLAVAPGTNLHAVIAQGKHEGMPAWSADLSSDQIDALAGFILSPGGSKLFEENCGNCHKVEELVAGNPSDLKNALEQGANFAPHADVDLPNWAETLNPENRSALLNFLIAPDGQRLFVTNCSACHGRSIAYSGDEEQLRQIISQGGMHLDMPAWGGRLTPAELDTLANYVVDPASAPEGEALFQEHCSACHGERIPTAENLEEARNAIESGGAHQTMPIWGEVLTPEQLDALVSYTLESSKGAPTEVGQELFAQYCAGCHGAFGEGGPNPTRPGDIIAPISSAEYLKTRDDLTLQAIISQGQPNFGMSPFGTSNGGPLEEEDIQAIVAYMRAWEENPPVELPPEVPASSISLSTEDVYKDLCAQCHGPQGEGGVGPSFQDAAFQQENTDQAIFDSINLGHPSSAMIGWGDILSADLIQQLVSVIRKFGELAPPASPTPTSRASTAPTSTPKALPSPTPTPPTEETPSMPSFSADIAPIFEQNCRICHGNLGGWDSSSYQSVMESGNNAPVIIPGDPDNSLLAQMLQGVDPGVKVMPPTGKLPEDQIQIILDWIAAGALDN